MEAPPRGHRFGAHLQDTPALYAVETLLQTAWRALVFARNCRRQPSGQLARMRSSLTHGGAQTTPTLASRTTKHHGARPYSQTGAPGNRPNGSGQRTALPLCPRHRTGREVYDTAQRVNVPNRVGRAGKETAGFSPPRAYSRLLGLLLQLARTLI